MAKKFFSWRVINITLYEKNNKETNNSYSKILPNHKSLCSILKNVFEGDRAEKMCSFHTANTLTRFCLPE